MAAAASALPTEHRRDWPEDVQRLDDLPKARSTPARLSPAAAAWKPIHPQYREAELDTADLLKISTWLDANFQYYCSYWGRRRVKYRSDPAFRPCVTFEQAIDTNPPDWAEKK